MLDLLHFKTSIVEVLIKRQDSYQKKETSLRVQCHLQEFQKEARESSTNVGLDNIGFDIFH